VLDHPEPVYPRHRLDSTGVRHVPTEGRGDLDQSDNERNAHDLGAERDTALSAQHHRDPTGCVPDAVNANAPTFSEPDGSGIFIAEQGDEVRRGQALMRPAEHRELVVQQR
jgi:hypothetical protein